MIVVVGAGVAGLAAAGFLRARGVAVTLIEAGPRIGGRAWTTELAGAPFDQGASWLHDGDRNPLAALAGPADGLVESGGPERVSVGGRLATAAELVAYGAAWDGLDAVVAPALAGPDMTLAAAMGPMMGDAWAPLVALWEGAIIAAADADRLGLWDWHRNRLEGRNLVPRAGVGAYLAARLATEVWLETPATRVDWGGRGVAVETARGVIRAEAAIVTVSTGVLAAGGIRFEPALPVEVAAAAHALPMGLLSKVGFIELEFSGEGRLGLADGTGVVDRAGRMTFVAWPEGRPHVAGFMGGRLAWEVAGDAEAAEALAREELGRALGRDAIRGLVCGAVTGWGTDVLSRGAYAYAGPGDAGARDVLEAAFVGERVVFAGEATRTDGLAGTVAGAYLSGRAAAARVLECEGL